MSELVISNGWVEDEERRGWRLNCPKCQAEIEYTVLNLAPGEDIYLYCDTCSSFVLREEDRQTAIGFWLDVQRPPLDKLKALYEKLERQLPACHCGGRFRVWSNIKCSSCRYEFPYNNGIKDETVRFLEAKLVWLSNAVAYRGSTQPSNRLIRILSPEA